MCGLAMCMQFRCVLKGYGHRNMLRWYMGVTQVVSNQNSNWTWKKKGQDGSKINTNGNEQMQKGKGSLRSNNVEALEAQSKAYELQ